MLPLCPTSIRQQELKDVYVSCLFVLDSDVLQYAGDILPAGGVAGRT